MTTLLLALGGVGAVAPVRMQRALQLAHVAVVGCSGVHCTPPWGGVVHEPFFNQCAVVRTSLPAASLLRALHAAEAKHGRVRADVVARNSARTLDIDIIDVVGAAPKVSWLPHPRAWQRRFVLVPAVEALRAARLAVPVHLWRSLCVVHP
jgi:2-amino-4-hydroxy-6-hydroxymethyldihydropteridine diphosphokinase